MKEIFSIMVMTSLVLFGPAFLANAQEEAQAQGTVVNCLFPVEKISVDGKFSEPAWGQAQWHKVTHDMGWNVPANDNDGSFEFACVADQDNLYIAAKVHNKPKTANKNGANLWNSNSIEIYINGQSFKSHKYGPMTSEIVIGRSQDIQILAAGQIVVNETGVTEAVTDTDYGWDVEAALPLKTWQIKPEEGKEIGFNIQLNINDSGNEQRDHKLNWSANDNGKRDRSWEDPSAFGKLKFTQH